MTLVLGGAWTTNGILYSYKLVRMYRVFILEGGGGPDENSHSPPNLTSPLKRRSIAIVST